MCNNDMYAGTYMYNVFYQRVYRLESFCFALICFGLFLSSFLIFLHEWVIFHPNSLSLKNCFSFHTYIP